MLVLARKSQESVVIAAAADLQELVRVTVVEICGGKVKLGFEANDDMAIHREEVWERVCGEQETAHPNARCRTAKVSRAIHRLNVKDRNETMSGAGLKEPHRNERSSIAAVAAQFFRPVNSQTNRGEQCQFKRTVLR